MNLLSGIIYLAGNTFQFICPLMITAFKNHDIMFKPKTFVLLFVIVSRKSWRPGKGGGYTEGGQ